eukprot:Pgem_evm1s9567
MFKFITAVVTTLFVSVQAAPPAPLTPASIDTGIEPNIAAAIPAKQADQEPITMVKRGKRGVPERYLFYPATRTRRARCCPLSGCYDTDGNH